jgi:hypothetical protein
VCCCVAVLKLFSRRDLLLHTPFFYFLSFLAGATWEENKGKDNRGKNRSGNIGDVGFGGFLE